jgi:CheY-like chemotaxis protein
MKGHRILVVEDNSADIVIIREALFRIEPRLDIQVVRDGQQALDYLSGKPPYSDRENHPLPELILLDLSLPRVTGFEILEWIRTEPLLRSLPVVILATSSFSEDIQRAYDFGANSFITKPSKLSKLVCDLEQTLKHWLKPISELAPQPMSEIPQSLPHKPAAA